MTLQAAIQEIVLAHHRRYGYRRVTAELRRRGMVVNHKRVLRMTRTDNLLAVRFRRFILTTDSGHECQVHLNLAARMTLTGINQLWLPDIEWHPVGRSLFFWLWSSTGFHARQLAGRWIARWRREWPWQHSNRPLPAVSHHRERCITPIRASSTPVLTMWKCSKLNTRSECMS